MRIDCCAMKKTKRTSTIGFAVASPEQGNAWHAAGVANGGTAIEDPPGVREGATPTIRGNKCYKNRRAGIGCRKEGTSPLIEDNDCFENGMAGIGCRDHATPVIRKNRCYGNTLAGIGCQDGAGQGGGQRSTVTKPSAFKWFRTNPEIIRLSDGVAVATDAQRQETAGVSTVRTMA